MAWLHNYRVNVSGSFVVQACDEDTAYEKVHDVLTYGDVALDVDDIEREDEDPYED